jgi:hypothetical protein
LKYAGIAALSAVDIVSNPKKGVEDAISNFKSGNIWNAVKDTAVDAADRWLPPEISIPVDLVANTCWTNPPQFHCTWKGAIKAVGD